MKRLKFSEKYTQDNKYSHKRINTKKVLKIY